MFLRRFQSLPECHGIPRHFMRLQISPDADDIHIINPNITLP